MGEVLARITPRDYVVVRPGLVAEELVCRSALAVRKMIGVAAVSGLCPSVCTTWNPSILGIIMSVEISSKSPSAAFWSSSSPAEARVTSYPGLCRCTWEEPGDVGVVVDEQDASRHRLPGVPLTSEGE